jgi:hypothetical protein
MAHAGTTIRHRIARIALAAISAFLPLTALQISAHEVPSELTVDAFVRPVDARLQLLIRVPLSGLMGTGMPKEGVGYLALADIGPSSLQTATQIADALDLYENGVRLLNPAIVSTRISLPFDSSFASYGQAIAHLQGPPLPLDTQVYWLQGYFDTLIEYPIRSNQSHFSFHTRLDTLAPQVTTELHFLPQAGTPRSFEFIGDPGEIALAPRWYQVTALFLDRGVRFLLALPDQWLFVLCMLIPWRRSTWLQAMGAFAAGSTLSLAAVTYGPDSTGVWLPALADATIAGLLVYLALENIVLHHRPRSMAAPFMFGAASGIGMALAAGQLRQFAGTHHLLSVLSFDAGLELGQLVTLAILAAPLGLLYRRFSDQRLRTILLSALLANASWRTLSNRVVALPDQQWPLPTPRTLVTASSWALVLLVGLCGMWLLSATWAHWRPAARAIDTPPSRGHSPAHGVSA